MGTRGVKTWSQRRMSKTVLGSRDDAEKTIKEQANVVVEGASAKLSSFDMRYAIALM